MNHRTLVVSSVTLAIALSIVGAAFYFLKMTRQPSQGRDVSSETDTINRHKTKIFGYVLGVNHEASSSVVDLQQAELFTSISASSAAFEDGQCTEAQFRIPGGCAPNNFYIRRAITASVMIPLSPRLKFISLHYPVTETEIPSGEGGLGYNREPKEFGLSEFETIQKGLREIGLNINTPYHFTIENGQITVIEEQLTP